MATIPPLQGYTDKMADRIRHEHRRGTADEHPDRRRPHWCLPEPGPGRAGRCQRDQHRARGERDADRGRDEDRQQRKQGTKGERDRR